ncbi:MAG: FHA domain-containing protein, partial [Pirellula sp.]
MLTSQNNSRTATAPIASDTLGEVRWYDESTDQSGEVSINVPQCTIGSNTGCTICLPSSGVADIHATLVFGKRFILLKAPYPTQLAGRQVRESLIDRFTELTVGSVHIEVVPRHEIGKRTKRPRVIRSLELAEHASLLSSGEPSLKKDSSIHEIETGNYDLNVILRNTATLDNAISRTDVDDFNLTNEQKILADERLVALETTLGKLQSAVEIIQSQSQEPVQPAPVDLSQQLAAMGKSVAEDLEQRLANRLDSQAASQATLVSQIRDEALRPIESTLEGLLVKLDDLSSQQLQTSDKLEALAASTDFRLAEWNQWRESLRHPAEQDYGTQQQLPQSTVLNAFEHLDSELQSPLTPSYNSDYLSQDYARQDFLTDDKEFPSYPELGQQNPTPKYPDVQSYGQIRLGGSTEFAGKYSVENNSFENEFEQGSELPSSEPTSWGEPSTNTLSDWVATQEENLSAPPSHPEIVEDVAPSFEEQPLSNSHTSDDQDSYSSEFGSFERVVSEEAGYDDYRDESPLAAYLKSSSTELTDQKSGETPNIYSANLDSYLATPEQREESAYGPSFFQQTPYSSPDESYAAVDESAASEILREPADELSIRLRQMLAEIKAEDEQSDSIAESDLYQHREIASEIEEPLDEKEHASPSSWLRDYAPSYPYEDEDRPNEIFNDLD